MFLLVLSFLISFSAFAQSCDEHYAARGEGIERAQAASRCHQKALADASTRVEQAHHYNRIAYLKFFIAEYFLADKTEMLRESFETAERGMLLFGKKYALAEYRLLSADEKRQLSLALYHYGLAVSRYVDIKGIAEALLRMDDIKRSMTTIIRLQESATVFHGAHRTLGIFHMKVPAIAGGDIETAKNYIPLAVTSTRYIGELSQFPLNNLVYADLLHKLNSKVEGCAQLRLVANLTREEVIALDNGYIHETLGHIADAQATLVTRQCP